uniref:Uncharacterized protein n=1 Tax=Ascaris lumbricoides TaxID=6252 RepID=A0A0M3HN05_ASCLU
MQRSGSEEPPAEFVKNELSAFSNNIANCISAISLKLCADEGTVSCVEECLVATEELHTLGELVRSEINVAGETLSRIDAQLQQLSSLFHNIDQLADYVAQVTEEMPEEEPEFLEEDVKSDDEAPEELSTKQLDPDLHSNSPTAFEQVEQRREERKKLKRKKKRRKVTKIDENEFIVNTGDASFRVIPLEKFKQPKPEVNFREQLLLKRTQCNRIRSVSTELNLRTLVSALEEWVFVGDNYLRNRLRMLQNLVNPSLPGPDELKKLASFSFTSMRKNMQNATDNSEAGAIMVFWIIFAIFTQLLTLYPSNFFYFIEPAVHFYLWCPIIGGAKGLHQRFFDPISQLVFHNHFDPIAWKKVYPLVARLIRIFDLSGLRNRLTAEEMRQLNETLNELTNARKEPIKSELNSNKQPTTPIQTNISIAKPK